MEDEKCEKANNEGLLWSLCVSGSLEGQSLSNESALVKQNGLGKT